MSYPDVSVVVVTWNVRDVVLESIERLRERRGEVELELIVVDNASEDGTVSAIRERFPETVVVANDRNEGFPRACNQGLERARGRHVLFLNPDAEPADPGTLAALVHALDEDPRLGAVGPRLEYPDGRLQTECARRDYRLRDLVWEAFYLPVLRPHSRIFAHQVMGEWDHRGTREVEALCGAFLLARREAAVQAGGFPEEVFMYHEDLSFCLRLRRIGWRVACLADEVGIHVGGAASSRQVRPIELLAGEVRVRLIRERSGPVWGALARALFGFRSLVRLGIALGAAALPGLEEARERHPRVFQVRRHALLLLWALRPGALRGRLPQPPPREPRGPRLLLVGPTPPPHHGNAVWTAKILASETIRSRVELDHLDTSDRRTIANLGRLDLRNVTLALRHAMELRDRCRRFRPDLVYLPLSQNTLALLRDAVLLRIAARAGRGAGDRRVVVHLHGAELDRYRASAGWMGRTILRRAMGWTDEGWVLGEGLRGQFDHLLPPERVRVVANGVEDWAAGGAGPERGGDEARPPTILFLGQLSRRKGLEELLRAAALLRDRHVRLRLILAGGWKNASEEDAALPIIEELRARAVDVQVPGLVTGDAKWNCYRDADIFVLPSFGEGQPLTILEAMAGGLPVVATAVGAIPDAVVDEETGLLVPVGDTGRLAEAVSRLLREPETRRRMGARGRQRFLDRFTREALEASFLQAVLDSGGDPAGVGTHRSSERAGGR